MKNKTEVRVSGGVSFGGLLQIAFIVLKLCGVIGWSWWWVFAPVWVGTLLVILVIVFSILCELL